MFSVASDSQTRRVALFVAVSVVIVAAAVLFSLAGSDAEYAPPTTARKVAPTVQSPAPLEGRGAERVRDQVVAAARRFLSAFFRYEVGDLSPRVQQTLRASATPEFATELLSTPPHPTPSTRLDDPAELGKIQVKFVSFVPPRAVVSGAARRHHVFEEFSFLVELHGSVWLVGGPGQ